MYVHVQMYVYTVYCTLQYCTCMCLMVFDYDYIRDFDGGVLGLAWVAQPPGGSSGGICQERIDLSVGSRSLNTAIVTYLNYGSRQPRTVASITIAHEFGHNFGSSVSKNIEHMYST